MTGKHHPDLVNELVLPTLLFAALGAMIWAVRGCSGFGAVAGCIFAGVTWGAAWWYLAHDPAGQTQRRYASGWIVPALTFGIGLAGARGWMQWPSFFDAKLFTDAQRGQFVPIGRGYGFLWLFIAGVPWAGWGACALAWCGSKRETRLWHWIIRIGFGVGGAALAGYLFRHYPRFFLPLYDTLESRYRDLRGNPSLRRLVADCGAALLHLGAYLGFLLYEILRRDWKNVLLILTVGLLNGLGWSACQNWKWANHLWGAGTFNFWRCWESCGGISIGLAYGIAWFLVNRPMPKREQDQIASRHGSGMTGLEWLALYAGGIYGVFRVLGGQLDGWGSSYLAVAILFGIAYSALHRRGSTLSTSGDSTLQRWGVYLGLLLGLGLSVRNGLKGWFNIYSGNEEYWSRVLWQYAGPTLLVLMILLALWLLLGASKSPIGVRESAVLIWLVLIVQNTIAQLVTGPHSSWPETAFAIYYLLLFAISGLIVFHVGRLRTLRF